MKAILEVKDLCALLGVSSGTIYTMVRTGEIPYFRVRRRILFNREVIENWSKGSYQANK